MENLDSEFNILKIDRSLGRERHICVLVSFKDLQDTKITIHLFVDIFLMGFFACYIN